jgi:hypothetical protein
MYLGLNDYTVVKHLAYTFIIYIRKFIYLMNHIVMILLDTITITLALASLALLCQILLRLARASNMYVPGIMLVKGICWSDIVWDMMLIISTVYLMWGCKDDNFFKMLTLVMAIALSQS